MAAPTNPLETEGATYTYSSLTVGDPANCVGICTLWTPQDKIARRLQPHEYGRIGNLYSRDGINHIIRNVLADPVVRYIIICGVDLTGSGEAFLRFAQNGFDDDYRIIGDVGLMDRALPREALEDFRAHVRLIDLRGTVDPDTLRAVMADLPHLPPFAPPRTYPMLTPAADTFPSEGAGLTVRGKRVADTWLLALRATMKFGVEVSGPFGGRLKDALDLVTVVTDEDAAEPLIPDWLPITRDYLEEIAFPLLLSPQPPEGLQDTEGQRLFDFQGRDQIERLIHRLRTEPDTHSATASLWDPRGDHDRPTAPNLMVLQARRRTSRLHLTAYLRGVDLYRSWLETAYALRRLQLQIAIGAGGLPLGSLTTVLHSAHIYDDAWELANDVVERLRRRIVRRPRKDERDPRGSFVIRLDGGEILVSHYSPEGIMLQEFRGTSAAELSLLIQPFFSQIDHALHIGGELAKAELALHTPSAHYLQDNPLELS